MLEKMAASVHFVKKSQRRVGASLGIKKHMFLRKRVLLLLILALVVVSMGYYFFNHQRDQRIAQQVYQELVVIDEGMGQLQSTAQQLIADKQITSQIMAKINSLTVANCGHEKLELGQLVSQLSSTSDQQPQLVQIAFAQQINGLDVTQLRQFKAQIKQLKITVRELKFQQNARFKHFNQQISQIGQQLGQISSQIKLIHGDKLQQLELAKLKFISKKLAATARSLHQAIYQEVLSDVAASLSQAGGVVP